MHVVVNAQLLNMSQTYRGAGVSTYSRQLLNSLGSEVAARGTPRITAMVNDNRFSADGVDLQRTHPLLARPAARIVWEQAVLPTLLHRLGADLVHGLVNVLPLTTPLPGVVTVHDLSFLRLPDRFPAAKRLYLTQLCRASVAKARRVIAVSQQTADDLICFFDVDSAKIDVVYNGVAEEFSPGTPTAVAEFRREKGLPDRFLLYVGTLEPRKNLLRLVHAYARWRRSASPSDREVRLVIGGAKGWFYEELFRLVAELQIEEFVKLPGFVPRQELADWYRAAEGFVYPSLFEGFGLPVIEAMACGTPVLCSQALSLREIVGDSALVVNAENEEAMADAIGLMVSQPSLRKQISAAGLARARQFSWQKAAAATLDVYAAAG